MYSKAYYLVFLLSFLLFQSTQAQVLGTEQNGKASFYAKKFNGRSTSCGEKFSSEELTAAHRSLPYNTMIEVTNLSNNKSVVVRVNDRGPYSRSRLLDLSHAAADQLGMIKKGIAQVRMRVVGMQGMILLGSNELITDTGEFIEKLIKPEPK
jgi:rare lipoprotein A